WAEQSLGSSGSRRSSRPNDRDNEQWDKYPEQAEYRRRLTSLLPTDIAFRYYDTKMPKDDEDEVSRLGYRWMVDCLGAVLDEAFAVKPPAYATILKLDKTVRDWNLGSLPPFNQLATKEGSGVDPKSVLRSLQSTGLRETALMYLHRRYFVEALAKRSNEPLRSKYAMSVLA
ncbi:6076_t:CDS:2, partial [Acaulospora colombiana]